MSVRLICDLCEETIEQFDGIIIAMRHWSIFNRDKLGETHFCKKCMDKEKVTTPVKKEVP